MADLLPITVDLFPDLVSLSLTQCGLLPSDVYSLIGHLKKLSELNLSYAEVHYEYFKPLEAYIFVPERIYKNSHVTIFYILRQEGYLPQF